jgi:hypothetical protein
MVRVRVPFLLHNMTISGSCTFQVLTRPRVVFLLFSLGIWLKPTNRFGLFGSCKLRFAEINNLSVFHINENQQIRCRFAWFGFSVPPNQLRQTPEQINRENEEQQNEQIEQGTVVR